VIEITGINGHDFGMRVYSRVFNNKSLRCWEELEGISKKKSEKYLLNVMWAINFVSRK